MGEKCAPSANAKTTEVGDWNILYVLNPTTCLSLPSVLAAQVAPWQATVSHEAKLGLGILHDEIKDSIYDSAKGRPRSRQKPALGPQDIRSRIVGDLWLLSTNMTVGGGVILCEGKFGLDA